MTLQLETGGNSTGSWFQLKLTILMASHSSRDFHKNLGREEGLQAWI
jgi:hypothetical protein